MWAAQPALLLRSFLAALPGHFYAIITFNLQPRGRRALATHRGPRIRTRLMPNDKNKSLWLHCHPRTQRSKDVLFLPTAQSLRSPADQRGPGGPDRTGRPGGLRLRCQSRTGRTRGGWLRLKGCHWLPVPKRHRDSNRRRPTATLVRVIARPAQVAPYQKDTLASSISNKGRRAALLPHAPHLPPSRRGPTVQARATACEAGPGPGRVRPVRPCACIPTAARARHTAVRGGACPLKCYCETHAVRAWNPCQPGPALGRAVPDSHGPGAFPALREAGERLAMRKLDSEASRRTQP